VAFRADAAFARPEIYEVLEARGVQYADRHPGQQQLGAGAPSRTACVFMSYRPFITSSTVSPTFCQTTRSMASLSSLLHPTPHAC